jgi:hypothetical protein
MIGSVLGSVDFTNPEDNPNGQVLSPAFGWNPGTGVYVPATTLNEKEGYWIAVFGECDLTVGGAGGELSKSLAKADREGFYKTYGMTPPLPPSIDWETMRLREIPKEYSLSQNYPNPFNPETRISYSLPKAGNVEIAIYNMMGRSVRRLKNGTQQAGTYEVIWDGRDDRGMSLGSGMYLVRLKSGEFSSMRKVLLMK